MAGNIEDQRFEEPVLIARPGLNGAQHISTTGSAARYLLYKWPQEAYGKPKHIAARKACMTVLEKQRGLARARKAFRDAAEEAGILIGGK